ncbi:hypothetical protein CY34DRAFT_800841 [Suillus luteus UH-Slu-Lm8-n1]|uniref:Uncharacterized protein n=1 Tax=Suillus luteus UH-Slu-Lm8-n1 TaxID=930992 RepID=A0A0D0AWP8_9AGAM|nr:hypothetical protein CY34DRAFT_800841 [Suillus luteus UH-Slu-Lm8-n1]
MTMKADGAEFQTGNIRDVDALALKTDYRLGRTQNSSDLDQSTKHFERALDLCPMDHPYRPAALFNPATAKFVSYQADETNHGLDILMSLSKTPSICFLLIVQTELSPNFILPLLYSLASRNRDFKRMPTRLKGY